MTFTELELSGCYLVELERYADERGWFARSWCEDEFREQGLNPKLVQCNVSFNHKAGTLRGMHFQQAPHEECKLIRCTRGSLFDVLIDLRPDSDTRHRWVGVTLAAAEHGMVYVPAGIAHGFITLEDNTELFYQMSERYHPRAAAGVHWNDPAFGIEWPRDVAVISERDDSYPLIGRT